MNDEKNKIALAQCIFSGVPYLLGQFRFARAEDPASVPQCERALAASADCRKPVTRDPRLIMNNCNFPPKETIKQSGLAYIRPSKNRHVRQRVAVIHESSQHLRFGRMLVTVCLQLTHALCDINDP